MAGNIVKEILLKFRSDTKDVDKNVKQMERGLTSLQKTIAGGAQGASLGNLNKTLETFTKTSQKFGMSINKDMSKFQKTIQDVAQKDLRVLQQQTDTLFKKTEERLRRLKTEEGRLGKMRAGGESTDRIQQQERMVQRRRAVAAASEGRLSQTMDQFNELGEKMPGQPPGFAQRFGGMRGIAMGGAALAGLLKTSGDVAISARETQSQATSFLANTMQQRRLASYRGDITEALMEAKDQSMSKAQKFSEDQSSGKGRSVIGGALLKMFGGIGGGALFGGIPGAIVGGIGGAISGGSDLYNYYAGGGKEQYAEEQRQLEFNREKQRNMTAVNYQYLQGKAPGRYNFQRQMQLSDSDALSLRTAGYDSRFTEAESSATAMAMRGTFGNTQGNKLARQAMELSRKQGMDLGSATGLVQMTAMSGGQSKDVKKQLTDVYTDAFSKGIVDSGLLEVFQKGLVDLASKSPDVTDLASMSGRMTATLDTITAGRNIGARDIQGVMQAQQVLGDISMQGGESGFTKMANLSKITGGNTMATAFLANRTDEEILQLAKNKDPRLMGMLGEKGVKALEDQYDPGKTLATKFLTTTQGRDAIQRAKEGLRQGKTLEQVISEGSGAAEVIGGTGKISKETANAVFSQVLTSESQGDSKMSGLIESGRKKDAARMAQTVDAIADTPEKKEALQQLLTRKFAKDISEGKDIDVDKYGDIGKKALDMVAAGRNGRSSNDIDNTIAGAVTNNQLEGEKQQDIDASKAFTPEEIEKLGVTSRSASTAPGKGISESVDTLVTALKSFADAVKSTSNSSNSTSSGGM